MRTTARDAGFLVPEFCRVLNYDELRDYMDAVPAPWLLKPVGSFVAGIRKSRRRSNCGASSTILATGRVTSCWSSLCRRHLPCGLDRERARVMFSVVHQYGRPPMQVMHEGGVFTTAPWTATAATGGTYRPERRPGAVLGMVRGVAHAEYIRAHADGRYYFLKSRRAWAVRFIADLVEVSTGVNLWREWARLEVANLRGETYAAPESFASYAAASSAWPRPRSRIRQPLTTGDRGSHEEASSRRDDRALRGSGTGEELLERYSDEYCPPASWPRCRPWKGDAGVKVAGAGRGRWH